MRKSFLRYTALFFTFIGFLFLNIFTQTVWAFKYIEPTSNASDIKKIQSLFSKLNIYKWEDTWKYSDIKDSIIDFQIQNKIISSKTEDSAWYIWPKTYSVLENKYWDDFTTTYNKIFEVKIVNSWLEWTETYFVVSAYYSPLPWQKRYATWSYARDIRLNWNWTHWASWVAVHPWFIAAPSTYSFGTKIEIEWLWVWTVEDRWWAIVRAWVRWHEYDRLDIWMWYWDEWLTRALNWWKKTVKWKIMPRESENTIEYSWTKFVASNSLAIKITPQSSNKNIEKMQLLFTEAKLYSWKVNWKYSSFKDSIVDFQINTQILPTRTSIWHWYIWTKTIAKLEEKHPEIFLSNRRKTQTEVQDKEKALKIEDKRFEVTISSDVEKKYKITPEQKKEVEKISKALIEALEKKFWDNQLKHKTQKSRLSKKVLALQEKVKKESTKEKLKYLYDLLREDIK